MLQSAASNASSSAAPHGLPLDMQQVGGRRFLRHCGAHFHLSRSFVPALVMLHHFRQVSQAWQHHMGPLAPMMSRR